MAGYIVAVVGGKGGIGKSVFTANLALSYLKNFKTRPLIVDLDFEGLGDMNIVLGAQSPKTIVELSNVPPGPMDIRTLQPFMAQAKPGYHYIGAPKDVITTADINIEGLGRFLKNVTNLFPITFLDCGNLNSAHALKAVEFATAVFVVVSADVIVINQTKRVLSSLHDCLVEPERIQIILNKYSNSHVITPQMIQSNLRTQIFAAVPEDRASCDQSLARKKPVVEVNPNAPISRAYSDLVRKLGQSRLLETMARKQKSGAVSGKVQDMINRLKSVSQSASGQKGSKGATTEKMDAWTAMKLRIHRALIDKIDLKKNEADQSNPEKMAAIRERTRKVVSEILSTEDTEGLLKSREMKQQMVKEVLDEALALGPLEDLLSDESVTEIMVNARDQIYIEQAGRPRLSKVTFSSTQQMMNVVERILLPLGRRVDMSSPYVDARLPDGSRVHVIIPPLALKGPTITIRKFPAERMTYKHLIKFGTFTEEMADFLRACVEAKLNVIVSGGTGSGKTTLLNVLSNFIPANERIITIEDSAELQLAQEHVVRLESRPKNIEGEGEVSIRDLVRNSLRMRPDRVVIGECRAGEALDMLQAMNTGHDGSLTTLHANTPREAISRLETLVMMAGLGLPSKAIKENISSAVNMIIQQARLADGSRRVTHISEVVGMQGEVITVQDIFTFKQEGIDRKNKIIGRFVPTGFVPKFIEEMEAKGKKVPRRLFAAS